MPSSHQMTTSSAISSSRPLAANRLTTRFGHSWSAAPPPDFEASPFTGPAYGDERSFNGLRLAGAIAKRDGTTVRIFCLGDSVGCAIKGQTVPNGYYHLDRMLISVAQHGAEVGLCGTCMDARGITDDVLVDAARRSTLEELTDWVLWADKTVTF